MPTRASSYLASSSSSAVIVLEIVELIVLDWLVPAIMVNVGLLLRDYVSGQMGAWGTTVEHLYLLSQLYGTTGMVWY